VAGTETIGLVLSAATLLVVGAAAVAAIVQLRHLRTSNQLSALLELMTQWNQPTLLAAFVELSRTMAARVEDPEYIKLLQTAGSLDRESHNELLACDFWEQIGTYAKHGLIDETVLLDIVASQVSDAWKLAGPAIAIMRSRGSPSIYENFEYLAVRACQWNQRYPDGLYPRSFPRMRDLDT
jgi:hypothetical protein